jgi:hypothetical protein
MCGGTSKAKPRSFPLKTNETREIETTRKELSPSHTIKSTNLP